MPIQVVADIQSTAKIGNTQNLNNIVQYDSEADNLKFKEDDWTIVLTLTDTT